MRVFGAKFSGHYINGYAVVAARDEAHARELLVQLSPCGPTNDITPIHLTELRLADDEPRVLLLTDGDY